MDNTYDIVIIGGGAVGCAIARELSKYRLKVAVAEKNHNAQTYYFQIGLPSLGLMLMKRNPSIQIGSFYLHLLYSTKILY